MNATENTQTRLLTPAELQNVSREAAMVAGAIG